MAGLCSWWAGGGRLAVLGLVAQLLLGSAVDGKTPKEGNPFPYYLWMPPVGHPIITPSCGGLWKSGGILLSALL